MNSDIEKLMKIQSRINKKAFHLCIITNFENEYEWELYMYMPNMGDYFSEYNIPILDSNSTTLEELEEYLKKYGGFDRY